MYEIHARLAALHRLADAIEASREHLQDAIVRTARKTLQVAAGEVELAIRRLRAFGDVVPLLEGRGPIGTVAIMFPGNASLSNPVATIGNAFLAGNQVVARFPGGAREWADLVEPLLMNHVPGVTFDRGSGAEFLTKSFAQPDVAAIMVFGDDAWAADYEEQARLTRTKFILEGPGKDPFLVLLDADLAAAARDAVRGGYYNAGQACTSPERFYVQESVYDRFVDRVVALTQEQVVGAPEDPVATIGPIVSERVSQRIRAQLQDALARGARLLAGGEVRPAILRDGTPVHYVAPTVLVDVTSDMAVMRDETFGPVIPVQKVRSTAEALALAAESRYGLAASLYGGTSAEVEALAATHGQVFHNEIWLDHVRRNLHAPYGGRKQSGWVWAWENGQFTRREGPRTNALEFSKPVSHHEGGTKSHA